MNDSDLILSAEGGRRRSRLDILCPGPFLFRSATEKTAGVGRRR